MRLMRSDWYQLVLISLGVAATVLLGVFFYREVFPEYLIYQNDYVALEQFRSTYTGEPPPAFKEGVKQILIERDDKGPPLIDRCTSCHVALQFAHFSPTKVAMDINGNVLFDAQGRAVQVPNEDYIWGKLDQKIADLRAEKKDSEADAYETLKTTHVGEYTYDVTKVLAMHPLMGRETRPFQYHPIDEYGCTSCHNGNGRGLTTEKAHGPVFDDQYEVEAHGFKPHFTEHDENNDPAFARMFNDKPGHELLFQTNPIFVGGLIQAKCMHCHQTTKSKFEGIASIAATSAAFREQRAAQNQAAFENEKNALLALLRIRKQMATEGREQTLAALKKEEADYQVPQETRLQAASQVRFIESEKDDALLLKKIDQQIVFLVGSSELTELLKKQLNAQQKEDEVLANFIKQNERETKGSLFAKKAAVDLDKALIRHAQDTQSSFEKTVLDTDTMNAMVSEIDSLTKTYHWGENLYISQACYACHKIAGLARGGVGPELTRAGQNYPWYLKESIVWPQADLRTSTMPNFRLDHEELESLMTFLLGQDTDSKAVSQTQYRTALQEWEAGKKMPWERPIPPEKIHDLRYSMTVFATEGCAACHRLDGFESNVGYAVPKDDFNALYKESEWFTQLVPETVSGSALVAILDEHGDEIDKRIVDHVRENSILEEIEATHPQMIEALYTPFKFAKRAKNHLFAKLSLEEAKQQKERWESRVHKTLMMFIQEYGLGRLIGPRPNWSGVYRSDEWLMEHFWNPSAHVSRSIMPVFPFDNSKFYALTYMLDVLGIRNSKQMHQIWRENGFNPELAYHMLCSQCHGDYLQGNGPVSEWIYPIPKNLRSSDFLSNLTKERAIFSIKHGVKGTPMPPWGEMYKDKPEADGQPVLNNAEIQLLADWLFSNMTDPMMRPEQQVPKWHYTPQDVIEELKDEGNLQRLKEKPLSYLLDADRYLASLKPMLLAAPKTTDAVNDYFDEIPAPQPGPDKHFYYIKKKYYTPGNLNAGRLFFEENCATCHGKEADGMGMRAQLMIEAKPRMLTNLDWLETRDDLRLLRSIKYGVPHTAMTPWGDLTSSLQRMQLVMYIRSLSESPALRARLMGALYKAFDQADQIVEQARAKEYAEIDALSKQYDVIQKQRKQADERIQSDQAEALEGVKLYEQELEIARAYRTKQEKDQLYKELKAEIKKEKDILQHIGVALIGNTETEKYLPQFEEIIALYAGRIHVDKEGSISYNYSKEQQTKWQKSTQQLVKDLNELVAAQEKNGIIAITKLRDGMISGFAESVRINKKEIQIIDDIRKQHDERSRNKKNPV